jgi:hypothetical protein
MDTVIQKGEQIIAVTEDDDTLVLSGLKDPGIDHPALRSGTLAQPESERTLILGWNWRVTKIINELDNYVADGSEVTVVSNFEDGQAEINRLCSDLHHQAVTYQQGDTTDRRTLDKLQVDTYTHVIILYNEDVEPECADSQTLITLLHLRDISDRSQHPFSIVSEMLDLRNRNLAEVTRADDFIVSDRLISLMLSQISENKQLNAVFTDIFDPEGSEIYLKPAGDYVALGTPVNFYTVVDSARKRGELAFGYKIKSWSGDPSKSYGVVVNPDKSKKVTFSKGDRIVMLAEN